MNKAWVFVLVGLANCAPGYIKSSDLEARDQGPSACRASCEEIGMRMTALVLVGNEQPGCVCQPDTNKQPPPPSTPSAPTAPADASEDGAAASTTGYVVIAAADAARRQAERRREQQRQQQK